MRRDFRATAFWRPNVMTDATGQASVDLRYPDSTTRWTARAVAVTTGNQVGLGTNSSVTRVASDGAIADSAVPDRRRWCVVISALLNNTTDQPLTATVILKTSGATVTGLVQDGQMVKGEQGPVVVPAGGEARAEWWGSGLPRWGEGRLHRDRPGGRGSRRHGANGSGGGVRSGTALGAVWQDDEWRDGPV